MLSKSGALCEARFGRGVLFPVANARQGGNSVFTSLKSPYYLPDFRSGEAGFLRWPCDEGRFASVFRPICFSGGRFFYSWPPRSPVLSGLIPRPQPPPRAAPGLCPGLAWHREHNGPDGALYPASRRLSCPLGFLKSLFIFEQPDFLCPAVLPPRHLQGQAGGTGSSTPAPPEGCSPLCC